MACGFAPMGKSIDLMDSDGFTYVSRKGKKKHKNLKPVQKIHTDAESTDFNLSKLNRIQDELKLSEFYSDFKEKLECVLAIRNLSDPPKNTHDEELINLARTMESISLKSFEKVDIICYGLGKFTSCLIARYQLAFLVILSKDLKPVNLHIYDPVFSKEEISILQELGMNVLDTNEYAKRIVNCKTIFFMPHCDLPLYNNLLWANWNKTSLSEMIIIGNSLQNYQFTMPEAKLIENAKFVHLANEFMAEVKIANQFRYPDIFNDLSVHYFKSDALSNVPNHIWSETKEPVYNDDIN